MTKNRVSVENKAMIKDKIKIYLFAILLFGCFGLSGCFEESASGTSRTEDVEASQERVVEVVSKSGYTLQAQLVKKSDRSSTGHISATDPGIILVTIQDQTGVGIPNLLVSFSSEDVTFSPVKGKAVTNQQGRAEITLLDKDETGTGSVDIEAGYKEEDLAVTLNLEIIPPSILLGFGSGLSFQESVLSISVTPLSAGGTSTVTATIVDEDFELFTSSVDIAFTSDCARTNLATIDATVATVNGTAAATYKATGCQGTDMITASINIGGTAFTATNSIVVQSDTVGSIEFVSASPTTIALQGAGTASLSETSKVSFRVKGSQGLSLANQTVTFSLTSKVGGVSLSPASAVTDSSGLASTVVRSGYIAQSVSVVASVAAADNSIIRTQSSSLVITTGIPDQDSVSLSSSIHNPEAWSYDGETITSTVRLADIFNNPVPDDTAVNFTTEGGAVVGACNVARGSCSVTWYSQNPRPDDGRVTMLVTAVGHENFNDINGNGVFDDGDTFEDLGEAFLDYDFDGFHDSVVETYTDTNGNGQWDRAEYYYDENNDGAYTAGEPFIDRTGNGSWTAAEPVTNDVDGDGRADIPEPYIDFDEDGVYDLPNGKYNGILCEDTVRCDTQVKQVTVRDTEEIVMSGSSAFVRLKYAGAWYTPGATFVLGGIFQVLIVDRHGNSMPNGTTVSIAVDNGELSGTTSYTIGDATQASHSSFAVSADDEPSSGFLTIAVQTPKGNQTSAAFIITD